jgi:O-antigen ligase/polysaccharide polymerase Wzy-like membrane protein
VRRPVWILHVFVVGLALHNFVMAELWAAGVRGRDLDVVSAWKELLLGLGLVLVIRRRGWSLRFHPTLVDWLALAFGAVVLVWGVIPQHWLDGGATHRGVVLGVRHDLLPVAAYFFGRGLAMTQRDFRRVGATILATASAVAAFGLIDIYAIPLSWWRHSGAPNWFTQQLGFNYQGLSGLPENFVYNTGNEHPLRRLVSFFLSPLATSYMLVTALLLSAAWLGRLGPRLVLWIPTTALLFAGLLWTHSRSSYLALALGLVVFAAVRPGWRLALVGAAVGVVLSAFLFVRLYPHIAPSTSYTKLELECQRYHAHHPQTPMNCAPQVGAAALAPRGLQAASTGAPAVDGLSDASTESHWQSLRDGISTVLRHPQGYGPGNAGSTAARTGAAIKAGESTYTELGVDTGLIGGLLFVAWSLALFVGLLRCGGWLAATMAAMLALGLQTDIIGVPWVVFVVWPLAGWALSSSRSRGDT